VAEGEAAFHKESILDKASLNPNGKLENESSPLAQSPKCPQCGSTRLYKDGLRYLLNGNTVQRWLCRNCGYRFSQQKPLQKNHDWQINTPSTLLSKRQVCELLTEESKNLTEAETRQETAQREGTTQTADVKGKLVKFAWWLQKEGYQSSKNRFNMLKRLVNLGADLEDPESVKNILAKNQDWTEGYKMLLMYAYESFLKMEGRSWQRPRYKQTKTLPFIPTEEELDQLINGSGKKLGTFLQGLKDTGADPGELAKLTWIDLNVEARTVNVTPVKGHKPRVLRVSDQFIARVQNLQKGSQYIFNYLSLRPAFLKARKFLARKLSNPRLLAISFTTFRHWKGTMEYHLTHDIIHVKELLGHRRIDNTMVYINLETTIFSSKNDQFFAAVATTSDEAIKLIEAGFDFVTGEYNDGGKLFRKRK
jgi:integrase/rubredoxin